jgi:hypothetical protein
MRMDGFDRALEIGGESVDNVRSEDGALVEGWAAAQVRRWQRFSVARELLLGDPAGRCKTQWL